MSLVSRFLEWYLQLPSAGAGQGIAWSLEWGPAAGSTLSRSALVAIAIVAAVLIVLIYWRDGARLSWSRRIGFTLLRLAAAGMVLVMLARLSIRVDRTELPGVAVLIDVSGSMGVQDRYADRALARSARELSEATGTTSPTRLQLVEAVLTRQQGRWIKQLQQTHQVRVYAFDEHLRLVVDNGTGDEAQATQEAARLVGALTVSGAQTAPGKALRELLDESRGAPLSAVILFSDGIATTGEADRLSAAAALARDRGTPLYPVAVGSSEASKDVELTDLLAEDVVYLGDPVTLRFRLRSAGYAGQAIDVQVTAEGQPDPLAAARFTLGADGAATAHELTFVPQQEGVLDLTVTAAPLAGEVDVTNNAQRHRLTVRREQFQVLLVERQPRWEYRALKPVLERDDTLHLDTFLQEADLNFAPEDRTALPHFPATRAELERYDAIIWGDVDLAQLDRQAPDRLREFVSEHGGGLILIAGDQFNPLGYGGTPLETLLPVRLEAALSTPVDESTEGTLFRLQRTDEGRAWSFLRLADDTAADEGAWRSLPVAMDWFVATPYRKPGAQVLAEHPEQSGPEGRWPLIAIQRYGRGQVLYHATDELWTWRKRVEDRFYGRYWSQAVRAVAAGRASREAARGELTASRRVYAPGEEVRLRYRGGASDETEAPERGVQVLLESSAGHRETVSMSRTPGSDDLWEAIARQLPLGDYLATVQTAFDEAAPGCRFRIESPNRELQRRMVDVEDLRRAAEITHGRFQWFSAADEVPGLIPRGRPVRLTQSRPIPLWNRWELLLLTAGLLTTEWILRKRARLV